MNDELFFSSKSEEWETPIEVFNVLHAEFHFTLDAAATTYNARCRKYYTKDDDALSQDWKGENVFLNPPYGKEIGDFVEKAYLESMNGATVVCLIPSRTDTAYWHDFVMKSTEVRLVKGRLKFVNRIIPSWRVSGNYKLSPAPFPSAVVVFTENNGRPKFSAMRFGQQRAWPDILTLVGVFRIDVLKLLGM